MKIDPLVIWQKNADGSGIVFSPDHCRPVRLNLTGAIIFETFAAGGDHDAAVAALQKNFSDVPEAMLRADVAKFETAMVDAGILR